MEENELSPEEQEIANQRMEALEPVGRALAEELEKIGLYAQHISVSANFAEGPGALVAKSAAELAREGEGAFFINALFEINKVAWTDRVLDPEGYELRTQIDATQFETATHVDRAKDTTQSIIDMLTDEDDEASDD